MSEWRYDALQSERIRVGFLGASFGLVIFWTLRYFIINYLKQGRICPSVDSSFELKQV